MRKIYFKILVGINCHFMGYLFNTELHFYNE